MQETLLALSMKESSSSRSGWAAGEAVNSTVSLIPFQSENQNSLMQSKAGSPPRSVSTTWFRMYPRQSRKYRSASGACTSS
jgi:hypothetical protein